MDFLKGTKGETFWVGSRPERAIILKRYPIHEQNGL